jgi:uncharacterized protein (UPF0297 family)
MNRTNNLQNTRQFEPVTENEMDAADVLKDVYRALSMKGYNPVNQIVGYIMSGDPTYITSYDKARATVRKCERDELLEEILNFYVENKLKPETADDRMEKIA